VGGNQTYESKEKVNVVIEFSPETQEVQRKFNAWIDNNPHFSSVADRISISNEGIVFD
jgi:hypothetical protein